MVLNISNLKIPKQNKTFQIYREFLVTYRSGSWIIELHGIPTSITLNGNPTFTNKLWKELLKLQGT